MRPKKSNLLTLIVCIAGFSLLGACRPCHGGGLLTLSLDPNGPTVQGINGTMSYDASTMEVNGSAQALAIISQSFGGSGVVRFSNDSRIRYDYFENHDSSFLGNGTGFELTGTASIDGTTSSGALLEGRIMDSGAESPTPGSWEFNLEIAPTGGLLTQSLAEAIGITQSAPFSVGGPDLGMEVFAEKNTGGTPGDYTASFSTASDKILLNPLTVSEPSGGVLAAIALVILGLLGRAKKRAAPAS